MPRIHTQAPRNLSFSPLRFAHLAHARWTESWRTWRAFVLAWSLLYALGLGLAFVSTDDYVLHTPHQAELLYLTLPLAGAVFAWIYNAPLKQQAHEHPHAPPLPQQKCPVASTLEHWLLAVFMTLVIFPLVHMLLISLIHWPASCLDYQRTSAHWESLDDDARRHMFAEQDRGRPEPGDFTPYIPWLPFEGLLSPSLVEFMLKTVLPMLWLNTFLSGIALLCRLSFRRLAGVLAVCYVLALLFATSWMSSWIEESNLSRWLSLGRLLDAERQAQGAVKSALHWRVNALFWLGIPLALWLATYLAWPQTPRIKPQHGKRYWGLLALFGVVPALLWSTQWLTSVLSQNDRPPTDFTLSLEQTQGVNKILLLGEPDLYDYYDSVDVTFEDTPHVRISLKRDSLLDRERPPRLLIERKDQTLHLRAERDASEFDRPESVHIKEITLPLHVQHLYGEHLRLYVRQGQRLPELHAYGNSVHWREGAAEQLTLVTHAPCETPETAARKADERIRNREQAKNKSEHPFPWMFSIWETDPPAAMPSVCADCADNAYGDIELNAEHVKQARVFISDGRLGLNHVHAGSAIHIFVGAEVQPSISFRPPEILQYDDYRNAVRSLIQRSDLSADYYANLLRPSLACQLPASAAAQATASDPQATLQQP